MTSLVSRKRLWTGRLLSTLAVLFLLFDSVIKLTHIAPAFWAAPSSPTCGSAIHSSVTSCSRFTSGR